MIAPPLRLPIALIIDVVARLWHVEIPQLVFANRRRGTRERLDEARRAVCLLAVELSELSTTQIAERFGGRDHSTVVKLAARAREQLGNNDHRFAALIAEARKTIIDLAASREGQRFRDTDPVAAAERIMGHPNREALTASVDAIVAMADRLLALEEMAAAAYRLLATLDALETAKSTQSPRVGLLRAAHERTVTLTASAQALTDTLASALAALGYDTPDDEEPDDGEDQNTRVEPACAAE